MATSVLDVRDTIAPPPVRVPRVGDAPDATEAVARLRWVPLTALAAGLLAVLQAVGLLAVGLTRIDGVLSSPARPPGLLVVAGLVGLAGWIVVSAGGGSALIDGASRRLVVRTSAVELAVVVLAGAAAVVVPVPGALTAGLPLPLPLLFAVAVSLPVTKLLLADSVSARRWVAQGPRVRVRQGPDPVQRHRVLCTLTLGVIALGLSGLALLTPVQGPVDAPASNVVHQP